MGKNFAKQPKNERPEETLRNIHEQEKDEFIETEEDGSRW